MKSNNTKKMWVIKGVLVIILLLTPQITNSLNKLILLEKENYAVGEFVRIDFPQVLSYDSIIISNDEDIYKFLGNLESTINFIPQKAGKYTIELYDKDGKIIDKNSFNVSKNGATLPSLEQEKIWSDKKSYFFGEEAIISINDVKEDYKLTIYSSEQIFKYLGKLPQNITFYPRTEGVYNVGLFDYKNDLIASYQFEVGQNMMSNVLSAEEKNKKAYILQPTDSIKFKPKIKNSKNEVLEAEITIDDAITFNSFETKDVNNFAKTLDFTPKEKIIEKIRFKDIYLKDGLDLGIENVPLEKTNFSNIPIKKAFAIDPARINFTNATVTSIAEGLSLLKCKDWNFTEQKCYGDWEFVMDLTPGEEYNFTLTPKDPLYGETNYSVDACYNEKAVAVCTSGELTSIQTNGSTSYTFNRNVGSPVRISFANESEVIDQILNCTVFVDGRDNQGNTWTLQFGNYSTNTWLAGTGQVAPATESIRTWNCLSYFSATTDDDTRFDKFGVRITTSDSGTVASAYIDWVYVRINYTLRDLYAPNWSNAASYPDSPVTYSSSAAYQFNTTWQDNDALANVTIEHNFTGTLRNYSMTGNISGRVFYYNYGNIAAGSYVWRTIAKDAANNTNSTIQYNYIINKASPTITLLLNGTANDIIINETQTVNITGRRSAGEGSITLYNNGTFSGTGTSAVTNITQFNLKGTYNITLIYAETQNYTSDSKTLFVFVNDFTPTANVTNLNETAAGIPWIFWNWTNPSNPDFDHVEIWLDGVFKYNLSTNYTNMTSLTADTIYEIEIRPVDTSGNKGNFTNDTARTSASGDTTAPIISNVQNISITDSSANITWDTNEAANSLVFYGTSSGEYTLNIFDETYVTVHNLKINSLLPSTTYYYIINSSDASSNSNKSREYNFTTLSDSTPPIWSNPAVAPESPTTYSPTGTYQFNTTWTDNYRIQNVTIEHNFTGTLRNYSMTGNMSNIYYYNYASIAAGSYTWRIIANDSAGNYNSTEQYSYIVNKAAPSLTLLINNTNGDFTINESSTANFTGSIAAGDNNINISLYIDLTFIKNSSSPLENITQFNAPGVYIINLTYPQSANYTEGYASHLLTVNDIRAPLVNLTSPSSGSTDPDGDIVLWFNVTDTGVVSNCSLYINGTFNQSKDIITQGLNTFTINGIRNGIYLWNVSCTDTANNFGWSEKWNFTVYINEFFPVIKPILCSDSDSSCAISNINVSDTSYETHTSSWTKSNRYDYIYINYSAQSIPLGSTIQWMNMTYNKYQNDNLGYLRLEWLNTTSGTWTLICQKSFLTASTPPTYDNINCNFNESSSPLPSVSQINSGIQLRSIWYYGGSSGSSVSHGTEFTSIYLKYTEDTTSPTVELISPTDFDYRNIGNILFQYTPNDANLFNCTIWGDFNGTWAANITNSTPVSGETNNFTVYLSEGVYRWNVKCLDVANNFAWALTNYTVNITNPDIEVLSDYINFSNYNPKEGENITLFALVKNRGNVDVISSFLVSFFKGDPDSGGIQIGDNKTITSLSVGQNITVNVSYVIPGGGPFDIYVIADAPLSANGSIEETDESNNKANNTFHVSGWSIIYGNISANFMLGNYFNNTVIMWNNTNPSGSIYVTTTGNSVNWYMLQSLSRKADNTSTSNDFEELDSSLNMTDYIDSVNTTFSINSAPKETRNYTIFYKNITNVPIINSTNTTNFKTGLLWDYNDGGQEFNATQDVIFFTKLNPYNPGKYGVYAYELSFPTKLKQYLGGTYNSVSYYYELE